MGDGDKGDFPLKIREGLILEANNFLRKKGLFPEDNSDDDDEMVFGDDDFPSCWAPRVQALCFFGRPPCLRRQWRRGRGRSWEVAQCVPGSMYSRVASSGGALILVDTQHVSGIGLTGLAVA